MKPRETPPIKSDGLLTLADAPAPWWVAHTRARFEKAFAWDLRARGVAYFLPMIPKTLISGGRKRRSLLPLFPSYVFFSGDAKTRYDAMATNRLCQTIAVTDQQKFVAEMTQIERALESNAHMDFYPHAAIGNRCRVSAGPLRGIEGIVIQRNDQTRLILQVHMLGQGAALEISPDLLETAE